MFIPLLLAFFLYFQLMKIWCIPSCNFIVNQTLLCVTNIYVGILKKMVLLFCPLGFKKLKGSFVTCTFIAGTEMQWNEMWQL